MDVRTFYFNTGVRNPDTVLYGRQMWRNGTKQIPFQCADVPEGSRFMFACNYPALDDSRQPNVIVREILDHGPEGLPSRYAYFKVLN